MKLQLELQTAFIRATKPVKQGFSRLHPRPMSTPSTCPSTSNYLQRFCHSPFSRLRSPSGWPAWAVASGGGGRRRRSSIGCERGRCSGWPRWSTSGGGHGRWQWAAAGPTGARADAGVAGGGGWPRGSPSSGRCGRGGSRERRWLEQGSKETAGGAGCELCRRAGDSQWQKLLRAMGMDEADGSG